MVTHTSLSLPRSLTVACVSLDTGLSALVIAFYFASSSCKSSPVSAKCAMTGQFSTICCAFALPNWKGNLASGFSTKRVCPLYSDVFGCCCLLICKKVSGKAGLSEYLQLLSGLDQFIALHTSYLLNTRSPCLTALLHRLPEIDGLLPLRFRCATALANGYYATSLWLDASNQTCVLVLPRP